MKYIPLVWRNLMRRKIRTIFTHPLHPDRLRPVRRTDGHPRRVHDGRRRRRRRSADDDPQGLDHPAAAEKLRRAHSRHGGRHRGPARQLVRRLLPGSQQLHPEHGRRSGELAADVSRSSRCRRIRRRRGSAIAPGALIGSDLAQKCGWKIGDRVPLISPIYRKPDGTPWEFTIDGIYTSAKQGVDKTQFFFHWDYLNETFRNSGFLNGQVGWYVFRVADPSTSDQLAKQIDAMFANSPAETKTATEKAFISDWAKQVGDIGAIMIAIATIVMFFILFVAGNAMAQSIRERTNELGVLKTIGFSDGRSSRWSCSNRCVIAVVGGGIGLALAWLIIAQGDPTNGMLPIFHFPTRDLIFGVALVLAARHRYRSAAGISGRRLKIVDALRRSIRTRVHEHGHEVQ